MSGSSRTDDECISVAEFLEFEFFYELSLHLETHISNLKEFYRCHPLQFELGVRHVLANVVTEPCRRHLQDKRDKTQV